MTELLQSLGDYIPLKVWYVAEGVSKNTIRVGTDWHTGLHLGGSKNVNKLI